VAAVAAVVDLVGLLAGVALVEDLEPVEERRFLRRFIALQWFLGQATR
jgi:hypothetical protein